MSLGGPGSSQAMQDAIDYALSRGAGVVAASGNSNSPVAFYLKKRPPYKLSGGEKRAVAIATVLAMSPDILVMDEPTAALDSAARRKIITLLAGFKHTKIIATHDLDLLLDLYEQTIVLSEGRVLADGPTADILGMRIC